MTDSISDQPKKQFRIIKWIKRFFKCTIALIGLYFLIILIGLIPVNNQFIEAKGGVAIYVVSNEVHADIIVPKGDLTSHWQQKLKNIQFGEDVSEYSHIAFGWGDRGFFLQTQTWDDFKLSVAANALLLPSESCMHVDFTKPEYYSNAVSVTISHEQYQDLVRFIDGSFLKSENGEYSQIQDESYGTTDAFLETKGHYHIFNTCNSWVGRGLKAAGVRVPWYSPLPKTPMLYIESGNEL